MVKAMWFPLPTQNKLIMGLVLKSFKQQAMPFICNSFQMQMPGQISINMEMHLC